MSLLPEFIPAAFPLLALSHFVALVSPGPDFFLLAGYAIRYRLRGSAGIGPGSRWETPLYCAGDVWLAAITGLRAAVSSD